MYNTIINFSVGNNTGTIRTKFYVDEANASIIRKLYILYKLSQSTVVNMLLNEGTSVFQL